MLCDSGPCGPLSFHFPPYPLPMPGRATIARGRVPVISRYESPGYAMRGASGLFGPRPCLKHWRGDTRHVFSSPIFYRVFLGGVSGKKRKNAPKRRTQDNFTNGLGFETTNCTRFFRTSREQKREKVFMGQPTRQGTNRLYGQKNGLSGDLGERPYLSVTFHPDSGIVGPRP